MIRTVLRISCLFLAVVSAFPVKAQKQQKVRNYIARNQDFVDRRATDGSNESFAKLYWEAYKETQLLRSRAASKRTSSWTPVGPMGDERLAGTGRINSISFHPTDTATFFICVAQSGIWKTTNSGASWTSISSNLPILRTSSLAITPTAPETMYVAVGDFAYIGHNMFANDNKRNTHYGLGVYKTTDGGNSWKATGLSLKQTDLEASLISNVMVHPSKPNVVIAAGQTGIYRSKDGGDNWTKTHSGLIYDLKAGAHSDVVLYAAQGTVTEYNIGKAGMLRSIDFGATWTDATVPFRSVGDVQRIELAPSAKNPAKVYALACNAKAWNQGGGGFYGLYLSQDSGKTYTQLLDTTYTNMLNWSLMGGDGGQGRYDLALYTDMNNEDLVSLGGINVWTSKNGGRYFEPSNYWARNYERIGMHGDVHEIKQHPGTGRVFICHDGGLSSTMQFKQEGDSLGYAMRPATRYVHYTKNLQITSFYRLAIHKDSIEKITAGAQDNSTALQDENGWQNLSGGDGMESAFSEETGNIITSSQYGNFYRYYKGFGFYRRTFDRIESPSNEQAEWTTPLAENAGRLWIGYGNLYQYSSFASFPQALSSFGNAPNRSYPRPSTGVYVNPNNTDVIYLTKRGYYGDQVDGKVWTTTNGGGQWNDVSSGLPLEHYPTYVTANDKNPNLVWVTFASWKAGEKVYFSNDGGKNWKNISYNLPNIPVNCVAYQNDSNKNVYIGTDLGVYYLDSLSEKWVYYSDGLPNVIVHELEVHPKSHKLLAATFGRGIWEVPLRGRRDIVGRNELPEMEMSLFPNPAINTLQVQLNKKTDIPLQLRIIDVTGKTVLIRQISARETALQLDVSGLLSGQYYLLVENGHDRKVLEFNKVD